MAGERVLPVLPALESLLPERGLRRGSTVAVTGSTSLALALVAAASQEGSWCAAVTGQSRLSLGLLAAAELGIDLDRFPLVCGGGGFPRVVAALLDGVDVVLAWPPADLRAAEARRLVSRGRERGATLVVVGGHWPETADLRLAAVGASWSGVGRGHGRLDARLLDVTTGGRGAAARERRARLWLPAPGGGVAVADRVGDARTGAVRSMVSREAAG
jgi:hypothetical protein